MNDKIKLVLSEKHAKVVQKSCEAYCRGKLGQFRYMLEEIFPELSYNRGRAIEEFIRAQFCEQAIQEDKPAEFYFPNYSDQYWSIGNKKTGDGTLAYEVEKVIENYLAVKNNDGYWGSGTNFSSPLCFRNGNLTDDSDLPKIENFVTYKDFPLSVAKSKRLHTYCVAEQWEKAWGLINNLRKQGKFNYEGGEQKIMWGAKIIDGKERPDETSYFIRVWKPRKPTKAHDESI